jgi:hypothetical protein
MSDEFSEVVSQSWFSRIMESIKGVIFGLIIFIIAFPLLFWNEGRAVKTAQSLTEGSRAVVTIQSDRIDSTNNNKLVHLSGLATTQEIVTDSVFHVSEKAIKLVRKVEMYQWDEESSSETVKKIGGGTETKATYKYTRKWSEKPIESIKFKNAEGHTNPGTMPYSTEVKTAGKVTLGAFTLSDTLVAGISKVEPLIIDSGRHNRLPGELRRRLKLSDGVYYIGNDPTKPAIGDIRISYSTVKPVVVSLIAQQTGDTFQPFKTKAGDSIQRLEMGQLSADLMFKKAQEENKMMTWILRVVGFLMLFFGLMLIFKPISTVADVVPFFGNLLGAGLGIFSFLIALVLWALTVAGAWMAVRPLIGIVLVVIAGGSVAGLLMLKKKKPA